jgi:hypothetical protein
MNEDKHIGQPRYGIIDNGMWGARIVAGLVTGKRYTENEPVYEISFGKNTWWTSEIFEDPADVAKFFKLAPLDRVKETHGLKIKFDK